MESGITRIREALERGESLTSLEAYTRFGVHHLASTIRRLRAKGMSIEAETIETPGGARVARYQLAGMRAGGSRYF